MTQAAANRAPSLRTYVLTYLALLALATVSWLIAGLHVPGGIAIGLGIGAIKALLVLAYFMHLESESFSFKLVIAVAVVLVAIFVGLAVLDPVTRASETNLVVE